MTAIDPDRDARLFFDDVYREQPPDTVIAVGTFARPHFVRSPDGALPYIVGKRNVFTRVTLLAGRPAKGRGRDSDSVALPGLVGDLDINGSPDGKGGTVTGAFRDQDHALEVAHAVLEPTLVVRSGYGLQPWWLFEQMHPLADEEARIQARVVARGWQERLRQSAQDVRKVDGVADLSRVMRPPGSLNGKGTPPVPVVLLDNGGPRYTLEQLAEHALPIPETPDIDPERDARPAQALLAAHPKLARIAERNGKAPGDGSASAWDYYLACEAAREGAVDAELGLLIRHARKLHNERKGARDDYVERTIAKARQEVPRAPNTERERLALGQSLSTRWGLGPQDPIVGGRLIGPGEAAIVRLRRASGTELRLGHIKDLFTPRSHTRAVSIAARSLFGAVTEKEAARIAQQIIALCEYTDIDERDLADQWTGDFMSRAGAIVDGTMHTGPADRWHTLVRRENVERELDQHGDAPARAAVIKDERGAVWIPAAAFRNSLGSGAPSWRELETLMAEIDWRKTKVEMWTPGPREQPGRRHIKAVFFVEPDDAERA